MIITRGAVLSTAGTIIDATSFYVELTTTQTAALLGDYDYEVRVTLASASVITTNVGNFMVKQAP